ncbi:MAG: YegP family protein [Desulfuromonadaceae bacterium]|nr:YegP family protein [Desulfuromonadaceae bacterium]
MAGKFELKKAKDGQFMFNLKATNGQVILTSELYKTKASAENGIESIKKNSAREGAFEVKSNAKGEPYFILKATNGQEIGRSEYYSSKGAMENGIESVKKNAPEAKIVDLTA